MKKAIRFICIIGLACMILAGCALDDGGSVNIPVINVSGGNADTTSVDGTTSQASDAGGKKSSKQGDDSQWSDDRADVSSYVIMQEKQTELGIVQMPMLNTDLLNSQDAGLAEAMFRNLEDKLISDAEDVLAYYKEQGYATPDSERAKTYLSETKTALSDDVLSILISYQELSPTAPSLRFYEGINLDIKTGKTVPSMKLVEMAGFTEIDLEYSISYFCTFIEDIMDYTNYYVDLAERQSLPDPDDEVPHVFPLGDEMALNSLTEIPEKTGKPWDALDRYPLTFYEGKGQVSVCAKIETPAGAGFEWNQVKLSHTFGGVVAGNPQSSYGYNDWRYPMNMSAACYAIYNLLPEEYLRLTLEPIRVDLIEQDEEMRECCYIINAHDYTDGQNYAYGVFAVGAFSGRVMYAETDGDEWKPYNQEKEGFDTAFLQTDEAKKAVAVLLTRPNAYRLWDLYPYAEIDATEYQGNPEELSSEDINSFLICPKEEDSVVALVGGEYTDSDYFEEMSEIVSYPIEAGLGVYVRFEREENTRLAIRIENSAGTVLYPLTADAGNDELIYLEADR